MKCQLKLFFALGMAAGLLPVPGLATTITETPGEVTFQDLGGAIAPGVAGSDANGTFFVGDIVLCDSGFTCLSSYDGVNLDQGSNGVGVSDVLRYADLNGEEFAILYSDGYWQSQSSFIVYGHGPGDLSAFIAAGFGRSTDLIDMGSDAGTSILETQPFTSHGGLDIYSPEVPEPHTWPVLLATAAALMVFKFGISRSAKG